LNNQEKVSSFLSSYRSKNTRLAYQQAIGQFFKVVYGQNGDLDAHAENYFSKKQDCETDIEKFLDAIKDLAPKSVKLKLVIIRTFLTENDIELSKKFWSANA
jgi:hypothetical protein